MFKLLMSVSLTALALAQDAGLTPPPPAGQPTTPLKASKTTTAPKHNPPHMELLTPIKRKDVDLNRLAVRPCGGTKTGPVHYETTPGSRNIVAWRIHTASPTGRCTLRLSDSPIESDFQIALPTDGSAGDDGSFPCGQSVTPYEAKEFRVPKDLSCDTCILQLEWATEEGEQYRCTDFESVSAEIPECFGQCLNGGICRNGHCKCPPGYSGSNCQFDENPKADEGDGIIQVLLDDSVILIFYALILALIIGLFVGAYMLMQAARRRNQRRMDEFNEQQRLAAGDKLTSSTSGDPQQRSQYAGFK